MIDQALPERSVVLRLEFSIADAVHQRGLLPVLASALRAWWTRPKLPQNLPAHLRADIGLPPATAPAHWLDIGRNDHTPSALRRPGM